MIFLHFLLQEPKWVNSVRFSPRKLLFKSEAKLVEVSVTLLMGSQSFCSDPYPLPSSFKTNSPWLPLTPPLVLQLDGHQLSLSVTLGWQFSPSPELKLPFAKPRLTTGASSDHRSRYESTPPSGRLVSDPPLLTGRNGLPFPLSRNCTLSLTDCRWKTTLWQQCNISSKSKPWSLMPQSNPYLKQHYLSGFSLQASLNTS